MIPLVMVLACVLVSGLDFVQIELAPKNRSGNPLDKPSLELFGALKLSAEISVPNFVLPTRVSDLQFTTDRATTKVAPKDLSGNFPEEPGVQLLDSAQLPRSMVVRVVDLGVTVLRSPGWVQHLKVASGQNNTYEDSIFNQPTTIKMKGECQCQGSCNCGSNC